MNALPFCLLNYWYIAVMESTESSSSRPWAHSPHPWGCSCSSTGVLHTRSLRCECPNLPLNTAFNARLCSYRHMHVERSEQDRGRRGRPV